MTSFTASLGTLTYRVSPGLASVGLKVILFTVRSAFIAPRTFSECEGSRLGGTAMVYNVFSKLICILVMAEGGYDPTTENKTPWEDDRINHDDDDDDEEEKEWHSTPGATSTPYRPGDAYHPGEEHEMTHMPQEQSGMVQDPSWNSLTFIYPDASATDLEAYMDPKSKRLMVRMKGVGKKAYPLYTTQRGTNIQQLNPNLTQEIRKALGESTLDQAAAFQRERDTNIQRIEQLTNTKD